MYHNMTLEEEIAHKMSMQMQGEIDREILWGMLKSIGWTRVMIPGNYHLGINTWLNDNCKGSYEWHSRDFIFENKKDASMFILRWL
jgi:hypothetical protein